MEENDKIFVDSNYFVALFNTRDSHYQKAVDIAYRLDQTGQQLVLSNFIFLETVTVLSQRRGRSVAIEVGKYLLENPLVEMIQIGDELQQETWKIFRDVKQKNISFVDCSILAAMKAESIPKLLTFDAKDFQILQKQYRFQFFP